MTDILEQELDESLMHEGVLRRSGRYPWGSGDTPSQRNKLFLTYVDDLKRKGMTEVQIAKFMDTTTSDLRDSRAIAQNQQRKDHISQAMKLKDTGMSNVAIGREMKINESSVRSLLDTNKKDRTDELETQANFLRDAIGKKKYIDVGEGVENHLGISNQKLKTVVALLKDEGYEQHNIRITQLGTDKETRLKVLAAPGTTWKEVLDNKADIRPPTGYSEDNGRTFRSSDGPPVAIDSKRVAVRYADEGGSDKDGVLEIRRGVDDISLGGKLYAQVRVKVDDKHYLKGMAMYADDLPDGVDVRFNTNKKSTGNKLDAMKPIKADADEESPFGAIIRPKFYKDADGNEVRSKMNIVNEEGDWDKWGKSLSSQVLSKQSSTLAKDQLDARYQEKKKEFDEILSLTNPTVKKKLLEGFAEDADSSAVHLKAAALPRQRTQVILPISNMKDTEVYAPNFKDGENVVLIRYPHGGIFEIPELRVNNRNATAKSLIGGAQDGIGISAKVAARLSGADFDGDTVLVIPNNAKKIQNAPRLKELKDFDPQKMYKNPPGTPPMTSRAKQQKMGDVSNLITDMTIMGATYSELARAVKHSMVVIDAEKHDLNWRQSAQDNGISELKKKYQGDSRAGAQTLISRASSQKEVRERIFRPSAEGGKIDPETGKLVYKYTDAYREVPGQTKVSKNGTVTNIEPKKVYKTFKSTQGYEAEDAYSLLSNKPTVLERVYADHANQMKALGNSARKSYITTPNLVYSPTAKAAYKEQVLSLQAKVKVAVANKPLERQAQLYAGHIVTATRDAQPDMDRAELKKLKGRALTTARERVGAGKKRVDVTPIEWEAIQSGAISNNFLKTILDNSDADLIKQYAMPRERVLMNSSSTSKAQAMLNNGRTRAEVAEALGVSISTLAASVKGKEDS